ncbi:MarR family winged helix-turn-helix transcriptional regulator [Bordetella trematum]|uniref:MarR family winged helix-turn-helix transcriptional regulator n=1 Tax=Bordetella trematum TaxID=123899 RepID=UPI000D98D459|nr:MarR family winged helix-turn-helix transcriptional regulator [Bordetella trematum]SPU54364.1 MarR family transcriptional regulator [Bordetella trematum]VDH02825.1 Multiple antibiotic resistance protein marR [Bordetella trematum]
MAKKPGASSPDARSAPTGYLPYNLSRLMNAMNAQLARALRPIELTLQQFRVMQHLRWAEVATIGEICKATLIEQSVVSRIVDQLEQRDFAVRAKRPTNARVVEVRLTLVGEAVYDKVDIAARDITAASQSILTQPELDELNRQLVRLVEHVLRQDAPPVR